MKNKTIFSNYQFVIIGVCLILVTGCKKENGDENNPTNSSVETVQIPAGTFTMGSPANEEGRFATETQRQVTLSAFKMSKYEITNSQFAAFLNTKMIGSDGLYAAGTYPTEALVLESLPTGDYGLHYTGGKWVPVAGYENNPAVYVTWYGAFEFASYSGGRLPTEAEWEYACRANTKTAYNTGDCLSNSQANYNWLNPNNGCTNTNYTAPHKTQPVGTYPPNAFGLYDMHGNAWEWCSDWTAPYPTVAETNPTGPASGNYKVYRGAGYLVSGKFVRSAFRSSWDQDDARDDMGFRIVFAP